MIQDLFVVVLLIAMFGSALLAGAITALWRPTHNEDSRLLDFLHVKGYSLQNTNGLWFVTEGSKRVVGGVFDDAREAVRSAALEVQ